MYVYILFCFLLHLVFMLLTVVYFHLFFLVVVRCSMSSEAPIQFTLIVRHYIRSWRRKGERKIAMRFSLIPSARILITFLKLNTNTRWWYTHTCMHGRSTFRSFFHEITSYRAHTVPMHEYSSFFLVLFYDEQRKLFLFMQQWKKVGNKKTETFNKIIIWFCATKSSEKR